jgi:hypothetical protein
MRNLVFDIDILQEGSASSDLLRDKLSSVNFDRCVEHRFDKKRKGICIFIFRHVF